jgi:hypothetical protein
MDSKGPPQAQLRPKALVQSDPLHEPHHLIDVRKALTKSGSAGRRRPMDCQHRHELRLLPFQGQELSLNRGWPGCSMEAIVLVVCGSEERMHRVSFPQRDDTERRAFARALLDCGHPHVE